MGSSWFTSPRSSGKHCESCGRVFAAGFLPRDGTLICRDCRAETDLGALRAQREPSPARSSSSRSSGIHCEACERVFAAGHLPQDGTLICRDCRAEQTAAADPELF